MTGLFAVADAADQCITGFFSELSGPIDRLNLMGPWAGLGWPPLGWGNGEGHGYNLGTAIAGEQACLGNRHVSGTDMASATAAGPKLKPRAGADGSSVQASSWVPRRYWFQAATNRPSNVTGIKPSTMPQSRGSIMELPGRRSLPNSSTPLTQPASPAHSL